MSGGDRGLVGETVYPRAIIANPPPNSPAFSASMVAFRDSMLVWFARVMVVMISVMAWVFS